MGYSALRQVQYAKEVTWGTAVSPATARWMNLDDTCRFLPQSVNTQRRYMHGTFAPSQRVVQTYTHGQVQLNGDLNLDDFLIVLLCGVKGAVTGATSGSGKLWSFPFPYTTAQTVESRTIEATDGTDPYQFGSCNVSSFSISGGSANNSIVQFKSTWECQVAKSQAITSNITDRATLQLLPALMAKVYADDIGGTVGTTEITSALIDWTFSFSGYVYHAIRANGTIKAARVGYMVPKTSLQIRLDNTSGAKTEVAKYLAGTGRLIQIKIDTGIAIGAGPDTYKLTLQHAGDWTSVPSLWEVDQGDTTIQMTQDPREDLGSFAEYGNIAIVNNIAAVVG